MARNLPQPLAFVAFPEHGIFEKRRPMESRLQHLPCSFLESKMASTCILMAVADYFLLLYFRHTPPDYLVSIVFVQEGFFPIIGVNFWEEEFRILCFPICW